MMRRRLCSKRSVESSLSCVMVALISFLAGFLVSFHLMLDSSDNSSSHQEEALLLIQQEKESWKSKYEQINSQLLSSVESNSKNKNEQPRHQEKYNNRDRFPSGIRDHIIGAVSTSKEKFVELYDSGFPISGGMGSHINSISPGESNVLILYSNKASLPNDTTLKQNAVSGEIDIPFATVEDATENCESLHVITVQNSAAKSLQCFAVVGNQNSKLNMHVQRWIKTTPSSGSEKSYNSMLRMIGRGYDPLFKRDEFVPPLWGQTKSHWQILSKYFAVHEDIFRMLIPTLSKIQKNNNIIVMTTNAGHANMLTNFVCSSRARNFDLSNLLVFVTDKTSQKIANDLGLESFYHEEIFGHIKEGAAQKYGDNHYANVMFAKIIAPHLVNVLGYDLLFMDLDIVLNKDPYSYFQSDKYKDFDIIFQDDGARSIRFAPYFANSGFYFARHNERTRYFFISMLYHSDYIMRAKSHQQLMSILLADLNSSTGLKVKTIKDTDLPGGFHYLRKKEFVRDIITGNGESANILGFHMHWTSSIEDKLHYMRQMGMWYIQEKCLKGAEMNFDDIDNVNDCCSTEAIVRCKYIDLPSVEQCRTYEGNGKNSKVPFWK